MNKVGRGFVKAAEFVLYLGITGAGIAGIAINGIAYKRAKDLVENYEHSQAVYSYIEEDLNNLNS